MFSVTKIFCICLIVATNQVLCSVIPKPLDFENGHGGLSRAKRTLTNETTEELFENLSQLLQGESHLEPDYIITIYPIIMYHSVLHQFQKPLEEDVSNFLIFWSNSIGKIVERKKIDILHCPFEKIGFFCLEGVEMMSFLRLRHF